MINEIETQLNKTASIANSLLMVGSAIFTEEPIKGVRKEESVVINRTQGLLIILFLVIYKL